LQLAVVTHCRARVPTAIRTVALTEEMVAPVEMAAPLEMVALAERAVAVERVASVERAVPAAAAPR